MLDISKKILGGAAALSILVVACTTTTTGTSNDNTSSGGTRTDGGTSDGSTETDGGDDANKCAGEKTIDECAQCCGDYDSVIKYDDAYLTCACENPCKDKCATTLCGTPPGEPDQACQECLESEDTFTTCDPVAQAECDKDKACKAFTTCFLAANCFEKPEG